MSPVQGEPAFAELREKVNALMDEPVNAPPPGLQRRSPAERARTIASVLREWGTETRVAEIIDLAGPTDDEVRAREAAEQKRKKEEAEAREAMAPIAGEFERVRAFPSGLPYS